MNIKNHYQVKFHTLDENTVVAYRLKYSPKHERYTTETFTKTFFKADDTVGIGQWVVDTLSINSQEVGHEHEIKSGSEALSDIQQGNRAA
jgi:hypothetical protein